VLSSWKSGTFFHCQTCCRPIRIDDILTFEIGEDYHHVEEILQYKALDELGRNDMNTDIHLYLLWHRILLFKVATCCEAQQTASNFVTGYHLMMVNNMEFLHEFIISRQLFYSLLCLLQTHNPESIDFKVVERVLVLEVLRIVWKHCNLHTYWFFFRK
jgi:hypothetical protein